MPIYEYECEKCNKVFEKITCISDRDNVCCTCGRKPKLLISKQGEDWFKPFWHEHLTTRPVYVESKKHYKELCKKYGVTARCL